MGKKKRKKTANNGPDPDKTIELKVPLRLFQRVEQLRRDDPEFLTQTIRAVFDHDELFGINLIQLNKSDLKQADLAKAKQTGKGAKGGRFFKVCEGP
ncbi:MAG: hypothetical protein WD063_08155 [Pirellulales bacterium]